MTILEFDPLNAVSAERRRQIEARLADVAREEGVRVLLAVESGSRAWGFHSPDSDYDVRFFYVRPLEDYLALRPPRDVIERPIENDIDLGGWDLAKALKLAARGNAVVSEWLSSPIVYAEAAGFRTDYEPLMQAWRSHYGDVAHYHGLARRQWGTFIEGRQDVRLKKYFYVIRPAVALHWLRTRDDPPPMNLPALIEGVELPADTAAALRDLRERKRALGEAVGIGPRDPALDRYISEMLAWSTEAKPQARPPAEDLWAATEAAFRATVLDG